MTTEIHGTCDERFTAVRDTFAKNFESGKDIGASFCATLEGETVVDIWAGTRDAAQSLPWERDTIINVYSTTKTMTALCALVVADRGELDFSAPVGKYWPEFAANGKRDVLVSHLMSHTAGLSGMDEKVRGDDLYDWEKMTSLLAAQAPWWEPGTRSAYHALTQGYLVGEVVRRITGETLGTFFRKEIAEPLGADFHIGTPAECDSRVGELIPPDENTSLATPGAKPDSISARTFRSPAAKAIESRTVDWRRAEIPAANGHGNARSVAEIHAVLANGGMAKGKQILSEAGCRVALEEQISNKDMALGIELRHGMGFGLPSESAPFPSPNTIYWGGWGGSVAVIDMDKRLTYSYVMNRMDSALTGDTRGAGLGLATMAVVM